eukprot:gnl/Ergobibamus_cyprinoides/4720.p2 GENE.gnl/Ergobibamus_cyprinoides/4720~~gnl/Ergobibamus_cyprinoides/4720.p2  ORF type:complete len:153 (+),score=14.14 gnl/Ergobibamus_cyprinoides/4720:240-698(+)
MTASSLSRSKFSASTSPASPPAAFSARARCTAWQPGPGTERPPRDTRTSGHCPRYRLKVDQSGTVTIALSQYDARIVGDTKLENYYIALLVQDSTGARLGKMQFSNTRDVSLVLDLQPGTYTLTAATWEAGKEGPPSPSRVYSSMNVGLEAL